MIILLDLNYTLVANSPRRGTTPPPMAVRLRTERYRQWLVDLVRPHHVILITARPSRWREATLERIHQLTAWRPQEAFFAERGPGGPPGIKQRILMAQVFPHHGRDADYLAIESNPRTRAMYARHDIVAVPVGGRPWGRLPVQWGGRVFPLGPRAAGPRAAAIGLDGPSVPGDAARRAGG